MAYIDEDELYDDDFDEDFDDDMTEDISAAPGEVVMPSSSEAPAQGTTLNTLGDVYRTISYGQGCDFDKLAADLIYSFGFRALDKIDRGAYRSCINHLIGRLWKMSLSQYLNNGEVPEQAPLLGTASNNGHLQEDAGHDGKSYSPRNLSIMLCLCAAYFATSRVEPVVSEDSVQELLDYCAKHSFSADKAGKIPEDVAKHCSQIDFAWVSEYLRNAKTAKTEPAPKRDDTPLRVEDPIFVVALQETTSSLENFYKYLLGGTVEGILGCYKGQCGFYRRVNSEIKPAGDVFVGETAKNMAKLPSIQRSNALDIADMGSSGVPNYSGLATAWANAYKAGNPCKYIPQLHISLLSGYTSSGSVSLKWADHKDDVSHMLTEIFATVEKTFVSASPVERKNASSALRDTVLNMVVLQRYKRGMIFSFAYSLGASDLEGDSGVFKKAETSDLFFLSKGVLLAAPSTVAHNDQGNILRNAQFCTNKTAYEKDINFAYKAVLDLEERGKTSSFESVLLGTTLANEPVAINMNEEGCFCLSIFGGSGSGKGVLTLATLGTAIATGHPFVYLDSKPDMAALLWGYEHELQQQGKNVRFLAVDVFSDTPPDDTAYFIPDRVRNNYGKNKAKMVSFLKSVNINASAVDSSFVRGALWSKFSQLVLMLDSVDYKGSRLVAVLDETNKVFDTFTSMANNVTGWGSAIADLNTIVRDKKTSDEEKEDARAKRAVLRRLVRSLGFSTVATGDRKSVVNTYDGKEVNKSDLHKAVSSFLQTSGRQRKALTLVIIGQAISTLGQIFPWSLAVVEDRGTLNANSIAVLGKDNTRYAPGALKSKTLPTGQFAVRTAPATDNYVLCKTYLTLNENDYFQPAKYTKMPLQKYTGFPAQGQSQEWIDETYGTSSHPNDAVGFVGYIKLLARTNGISEDQLYKTMNEGYERAMHILSKRGILQHFGYTCVEDWLYDLDPESFLDLSTLTSIEGDYFAQDVADEDDPVVDENGNEIATGTPTPMSDMQAAFSSMGQEDLNGDRFGADAFSPNATDAQPLGIITPADNISLDDEVDLGYEDDSNSGIINQEPSYAESGSSYEEPVQNYEEPVPSSTQSASSYEEPAPSSAAPNLNKARSSTQVQTVPQEINNLVAVPDLTRTDASERARRRLMTSYGELDPELDSKLATAYKVDSSVAKVDCGRGEANVFAKYHNTENPTNFKLLRRDLTRMLLHALSEAYGSLDAINSFEEQNGVLYVNKQTFDPDLTGMEYLSPALLRKAVEGKLAYFFNFNALKQLKNLTTLIISSVDIVDCYFWSDLGFTYDNIYAKTRKHWVNLRVLRIGDVDYMAEWHGLAEDQAAEARAREEQRVLEEAKRREKGRSFAAAFATALGIPVSSADEHPLAKAFGSSKPARAVRKGAMFGAACWLGWGLISLANPFLLLGGAFATAAFVKSCVSKKDSAESARKSFKDRIKGDSDAQQAFNDGLAYGSNPPKAAKKK